MEVAPLYIPCPHSPPSPPPPLPPPLPPHSIELEAEGSGQVQQGLLPQVAAVNTALERTFQGDRLSQVTPPPPIKMRKRVNLRFCRHLHFKS